MEESSSTFSSTPNIANVQKIMESIRSNPDGFAKCRDSKLFTPLFLFFNYICSATKLESLLVSPPASPLLKTWPNQQERKELFLLAKANACCDDLDCEIMISSVLVNLAESFGERLFSHYSHQIIDDDINNSIIENETFNDQQTNLDLFMYAMIIIVLQIII